MLKLPARATLVAAAVLALAGLAATGFFALHGATAQAQTQARGLMSAPTCQCSVPTAIVSMSSSVVHCQCGGMSCVVSEHQGQGKSMNLMQCVR